MDKKKNLLNLFTEDVTYNFHLIKTEEPSGHLIYLIKNGSPINTDTLEFSKKDIAEELISECNIEIEKVTCSVYFTKEDNTEKLKYQLTEKLVEDSEFSNFIEEIKNEYRILEIKDTLLYKKDPKAYEESRRQEHIEHQKELWDRVVEQYNKQKKDREDALIAYDNNIIELLKEYFESIIEYEKQDFDFFVELDKIISNLIDPETFIKIDDSTFICRTEIIKLENDKIYVVLTDNNIYYTATLRFDKTSLLTEDAKKLEIYDIPETKSDYEILIQLYNIDVSEIKEWEYKSESERFKYVIDYLVPIFKTEKERKTQEFIDKIKKEDELELGEIELGENDDDEDEDEDEDDNTKKHLNPSDWYFDVFVPEDLDDMNPSCIALFENFDGLDDQLGSHNLSKNVINALNRAGIYGDCELMEAIWEVSDSLKKTKKDIIFFIISSL